MQTHEVELLEPDTLQHRHKQLAAKKLEHEMEIPFLEIFWKFLLWSLDLAEKPPVQMVHPCKVKHAIGECGGGHDAVAIRDIGVQMREEGGLVLLPMSIAGHWTLLAIDVELREVRFVDTLAAIKVEILEKVEVLLQILREEIAGLEWLPAGVESCRIHHITGVQGETRRENNHCWWREHTTWQWRITYFCSS